MKIAGIATVLALSAVAAPVFADSHMSTGGLVDPIMQAAIDSGVCGEARVATAVLNEAENVIEVTCEEDVAGFVPLVGGLGPLLAGGAAVLVAAAAGGGATSDTQ